MNLYEKTVKLSENDGVLEPIDKERGMARAEEKFPSKKLRRVQIVQWNREEETKKIMDLVDNLFEVEEFLPSINPETSVTAHAGVDFLGIAFAEANKGNKNA